MRGRLFFSKASLHTRTKDEVYISFTLIQFRIPKIQNDLESSSFAPTGALLSYECRLELKWRPQDAKEPTDRTLTW